MLSFWKSETGAVTVDWVVMSAVFVGVSIAMMILVEDGVEVKSVTVQSRLSDTGGTLVLWTGSGYQGMTNGLCPSDGPTALEAAMTQMVADGTVNQADEPTYLAMLDSQQWSGFGDQGLYDHVAGLQNTTEGSTNHWEMQAASCIMEGRSTDWAAVDDSANLLTL